MHTLHLVGVEAAKSLVGVFFLFVFINPLGPINLNVLVLLSGLDESWPKGSIGFLFLKGKEHMESGLTPLGLFSDDLVEELQLEGILFAATLSLKIEMCGSQVDLFVGDVHEVELDEDAVLALRPFSCGVAELEGCTAFGVEG
jgi:hypothetical protein